ncbi:MAG: tRNA-dihydrouridine synthase, partial [Pseudomonadota bacterium]
AQGRPWHIHALHEFLEGRGLPCAPTVDDQRCILLEHYDAMLGHYGSEWGNRIARKHICWYSKELPGSAAFRAAVTRLDQPAEVQSMISSFYDAAAERIAA